MVWNTEVKDCILHHTDYEGSAPSIQTQTVYLDSRVSFIALSPETASFQAPEGQPTELKKPQTPYPVEFESLQLT